MSTEDPYSEDGNLKREFWLKSIEESRSEEAKGDPISVDSRGVPDGKLDPDLIDKTEVEGGVTRMKSSGHTVERHQEFKEAGLDPAANQGFIDTDASGEDDRVELKHGEFEGDYQQFKQDISSLDSESSADMNASKWTDLDPSGRGNGDTGGQETPPENTVDLNEWGQFDDPPGPERGESPPPWMGNDNDSMRGGGRPRRPDGQRGSSIFGGGGGGSGDSDSGGSGALPNLSPTQKKAAAATAAGGIGLGALLLLVL